MKERKSFQEVLNNSDDQVLVRRLISEFMTEQQKQNVVDAFNGVARERVENKLENGMLRESELKALSK